MKDVIRYSALLVLLGSSCSVLLPEKLRDRGESSIPSLAKETKPVFVTSDRNGGWSNGGYYVHNNMWNSTKYSPCKETLYAWSFDNWYVVVNMNNRSPNFMNSPGTVIPKCPRASATRITADKPRENPRILILPTIIPSVMIKNKLTILY